MAIAATSIMFALLLAWPWLRPLLPRWAAVLLPLLGLTAGALTLGASLHRDNPSDGVDQSLVEPLASPVLAGQFDVR